MLTPIRVDVLMPLPEGWGLCSACEMLAGQAGLGQEPSDRGLDEYPPEWQAEFRLFCELMFDLSARYGDTVLFRILDPRSMPGLIKALRHGAHRYPAFILPGGGRIAGFDKGPLEKGLEACGAILQTESIPATKP
jgi:hypothetical protein